MIQQSTSYTRGYVSGLSKFQKQEFQRHFCEKSVLKATAYTSFYTASIFGVIGFCYWAFWELDNVALQMLLFLMTALVVVRQMRGLENIVHFGSHNNFTARRGLNDLLVNMLAGWPMLQSVPAYRQFHRAHHGTYGSHDDPCRARLLEIGVPIDRMQTRYQLFVAIVRSLPRYAQAYYREVRSETAQLVQFCGWHSTATLCAATLVSVQYAAFQIVFWLVCMLVVLPLLRSVAELSEHDYERSDTMAETTFNNLSWLDHVLVHPAGDAWHALHHLFPAVSWWNQRAAHDYLMTHDNAYRYGLHRFDFFSSSPEADQMHLECKPTFTSLNR